MSDYRFNLLSKKQNFSVTVEGITQTLKKFDLLDENIRKEVDVMMNSVVDDWQKEIFYTAPVDTERYRNNWFRRKIRSGYYQLYNSYANVVDERGVHYADALVYGIYRFKSIASDAKYYYGNPSTGALHDINMLNHEMVGRSLTPRLNDFVKMKIKQAEKKAGFAEVT